MMALVMGLGLTSCMDDDWKAPSGDTPAYGNNTLQEKNVISIAKLKDCLLYTSPSPRDA